MLVGWVLCTHHFVATASPTVQCLREAVSREELRHTPQEVGAEHPPYRIKGNDPRPGQCRGAGFPFGTHVLVATVFFLHAVKA